MKVFHGKERNFLKDIMWKLLNSPSDLCDDFCHKHNQHLLRHQTSFASVQTDR